MHNLINNMVLIRTVQNYVILLLTTLLHVDAATVVYNSPEAQHQLHSVGCTRPARYN